MGIVGLLVIVLILIVLGIAAVAKYLMSGVLEVEALMLSWLSEICCALLTSWNPRQLRVCIFLTE